MSQHRGKQADIQTYWQQHSCQLQQQQQSNTKVIVIEKQIINSESEGEIPYCRQNCCRVVALIGGYAETTNAATAPVTTISTAQVVPIAEIGDFEKFKHKMANTLSVMTNVLRHVVSKKRIRYKEKGFNLDLAYINDNIIAMGYPADNIEKFYRNPYEDVYKFLEENHKDHYKIYNLCLERSHDRNKFHGRIAVYPFEDHNPPTIELIQKFCEDVDIWLKADSRNVAAVHCKAGKGRTGTMICCYLMYSRQQKTADDALSWYDEKRTKDRKGVTIPSQRRYVQYFSQLIQTGAHYEKRTLQLCEIRFIEANLLQNLGTANCSISVLQDTANAVEVQTLQTKTIDFRKSFTLDMKNPALTVSGDIKIELASKKKLFHFWFNTYFVSDALLTEGEGEDKTFIYTLNKWEIDDAHKDKEHKCFSEDFRVQLVFFADCTVNRNHNAENNRALHNQRTTSTLFAKNYDLPMPTLPPPPLTTLSSNITNTTTATTNYILEQKSSSSPSVCSLDAETFAAVAGGGGAVGSANNSSNYSYDMVDIAAHEPRHSLGNSASASLQHPMLTEFRNRRKQQKQTPQTQAQTQTQLPTSYYNLVCSNNSLHHAQSQFTATATSTPNAKMHQQQHHNVVGAGSVSAVAIGSNCVQHDTTYFNNFGQQLQSAQQQHLQQYQPSSSVPKSNREQQNKQHRISKHQDQKHQQQQQQQQINHTLNSSNSKNNSISSNCSTAISNNSGSSSGSNSKNNSNNCSSNSNSSSNSSGSSSSSSSSSSNNSSINSADNDTEEDWESGESPAATQQLLQQNALLLSTTTPTPITTTTTNNNNNNTIKTNSTNAITFPNISLPTTTTTTTITNTNNTSKNSHIYDVQQKEIVAPTDNPLLNLYSISHNHNNNHSSTSSSNVCNTSHSTTAVGNDDEHDGDVVDDDVDNVNETLRICGGEEIINVRFNRNQVVDVDDDDDGIDGDDIADDDYVHVERNVGAHDNQAHINLVQMSCATSTVQSATSTTAIASTVSVKPTMIPVAATPVDSNLLQGCRSMALNDVKQHHHPMQQQQHEPTVKMQIVTPPTRRKLLQLLSTPRIGDDTTSSTEQKSLQIVGKPHCKTKNLNRSDGNLSANAQYEASGSSGGCGGVAGGGGGLASSSKQKLKNKLKKNKLKWSMKFQWFQKYFRNDPDDFHKNVMQQTTKIMRRNSTCSMLSSRAHKLSTTTPPPPSKVLLPPPQPPPSSSHPQPLPAIALHPSSSSQNPASQPQSLQQPQPQPHGQRESHDEPPEVLNYSAKLSSSLPSFNGDFVGAIIAARAAQRKSSCASATASTSNASLSVGDVCEDFYSSLCDNQLSFSNSPCKSPRSLADSLSFGCGTPGGSFGGGGSTHLRLNSDGSPVNTALLANIRRNVVIVAAKPAAQHAIGFNVQQQQQHQHHNHHHHVDTLPLQLQTGRVPPLAMAEPTTPNSCPAENDAATTASSSIYYTPPTAMNGDGSSVSNNVMGPFVFPHPNLPTAKSEGLAVAAAVGKQRHAMLNLLIPKNVSPPHPTGNIKLLLGRDSLSSNSSDVDEGEGDDEVVGEHGEQKQVAMEVAGDATIPLAALAMRNNMVRGGIGGDEVVHRAIGGMGGGVALGQRAGDGGVGVHDAYACSNSSSSGVCTSECCTNSSSSTCSYNPLQIDLERHEAKQQLRQLQSDNGNNTNTTTITTTSTTTTTTTNSNVANISNVTLLLAKSRIVEALQQQ